MIRGIGDPLVAMYARTYLARKGNCTLFPFDFVGHEVAPNIKDYLIGGFDDFMFTEKLFKTEKFKEGVKKMHVTYAEYNNLYSPALDWQLQCLGHNGTQVWLNPQATNSYRNCWSTF